jgi:hypothetical protein
MNYRNVHYDNNDYDNNTPIMKFDDRVKLLSLWQGNSKDASQIVQYSNLEGNTGR